MIIGNFQKEGESYFGNIQTMTQNIAVSIKPVKSTSKEGSPTHRVFTKAGSGNDIGAAWANTSDKTGKNYLSVIHRLILGNSWGFPIELIKIGSSTFHVELITKNGITRIQEPCALRTLSLQENFT